MVPWRRMHSVLHGGGPLGLHFASLRQHDLGQVLRVERVALLSAHRAGLPVQL
jgi:hypothetical protein